MLVHDYDLLGVFLMAGGFCAISIRLILSIKFSQNTNMQLNTDEFVTVTGNTFWLMLFMLTDIVLAGTSSVTSIEPSRAMNLTLLEAVDVEQISTMDIFSYTVVTAGFVYLVHALITCFWLNRNKENA